ncbi:MAG: hypothetical protein GY943_20900 [Chloroflexi bacterium]|nr:hypothetical protein [Chloroflexota bacterium]
MKTITINIKDNQLADKVLWLLEHFQGEGLEIVSKEDMDDLKLLRATRNDESVPFDDYLKNEH